MLNSEQGWTWTRADLLMDLTACVSDCLQKPEGCRCLNYDGSEKQLANQLGISPHTLHSHIKSIYRKIGVQGRLALLRRADDARRAVRLSRLAARPTSALSHGNALAVAIG